ncbi:MAG: hypothetical protein MUF00_19865 [Gemmatimonadaceae bacterium]|nr:hypothetical protein [Gemmatimonadaceae bacterium]
MLVATQGTQFARLMHAAVIASQGQDLASEVFGAGVLSLLQAIATGESRSVRRQVLDTLLDLALPLRDSATIRTALRSVRDGIGRHSEQDEPVIFDARAHTDAALSETGLPALAEETLTLLTKRLTETVSHAPEQHAAYSLLTILWPAPLLFAPNAIDAFATLVTECSDHLRPRAQALASGVATGVLARPVAQVAKFATLGALATAVAFPPQHPTRVAHARALRTCTRGGPLETLGVALARAVRTK